MHNSNRSLLVGIVLLRLECKRRRELWVCPERTDALKNVLRIHFEYLSAYDDLLPRKLRTRRELGIDDGIQLGGVLER